MRDKPWMCRVCGRDVPTIWCWLWKGKNPHPDGKGVGYTCTTCGNDWLRAASGLYRSRWAVANIAFAGADGAIDL